MPNESREAEKRTDTARPVDRRIIAALDEIAARKRHKENLQRALDRQADLEKEIEKID